MQAIYETDEEQVHEKDEEYVTYNVPTPKGSSKNQVRAGVKDGSIPSAVVDSGTISIVGRPQDIQSFIPTWKLSEKEFAVANGEIEKATEQMLMEHEVRESVQANL